MLLGMTPLSMLSSRLMRWRRLRKSMLGGISPWRLLLFRLSECRKVRFQMAGEMVPVSPWDLRFRASERPPANNMCMKKNRKKWKQEKKRRKRKKEEWQERYEEGWIKWKINKVQGRMSRCWETKLPLFFPTLCNSTTRTSSVPHSIIFFCLCTCPPFYIFLSLISPHMV
jgi:hypothetical protein